MYYLWDGLPLKWVDIRLFIHHIGAIMACSAILGIKMEKLSYYFAGLNELL